MSKKQTTKRGTSKPGTDDADGNVDKIRDILFGSQMRDYEQRLEATEKRIMQSIERLSRDMERRVDRLDKYARREVEKLSERIKTERKERAADAKKGTGEMSKLNDHLESSFAEIDEKLAAESRGLRNSLLDQAEDLAAQLQEVRTQLQEALEKEAASLQNEKLNREDMAALFTEVAMRLNKDFKLPKG
jgi:archaellum component FlaC